MPSDASQAHCSGELDAHLSEQIKSPARKAKGSTVLVIPAIYLLFLFLKRWSFWKIFNLEGIFLEIPRNLFVCGWKAKEKNTHVRVEKAPVSLRVLALGKVSCAAVRDRQKAKENSLDGLMMADGSLFHSFWQRRDKRLYHRGGWRRQQNEPGPPYVLLFLTMKMKILHPFLDTSGPSVALKAKNMLPPIGLRTLAQFGCSNAIPLLI